MPMADGVLPPFRDEEAVVIAALDTYFAGLEETVYTGIETPFELEEQLPFVRISRIGGAAVAGAEHTDRPVVDVDVYGATRSQAKLLAQRVEQFLLSTPHPIDHCNVLIAPMMVEWIEDSPIRRFYASYHLGLRR